MLITHRDLLLNWWSVVRVVSRKERLANTKPSWAVLTSACRGVRRSMRLRAATLIIDPGKNSVSYQSHTVCRTRRYTYVYLDLIGAVCAQIDPPLRETRQFRVFSLALSLPSSIRDNQRLPCRSGSLIPCDARLSINDREIVTFANLRRGKRVTRTDGC